MKVLLKQDVPGLGKANEIKEASDGYCRNYLFPKNLAVPATDAIVKSTQQLRLSKAEQEQRVKERSQRIAEKLKQESLHFKAKAGDRGRLYGSITSGDIAEALGRLLGGPFDKRHIVMPHPLRELGTHSIELKLDGGVRAQARVIVEAEE